MSVKKGSALLHDSQVELLTSVGIVHDPTLAEGGESRKGCAEGSIVDLKVATTARERSNSGSETVRQ